MSDKLTNTDTIDLSVIDEAIKKLKDFRIKPISIGGKEYYAWMRGDDGGWVPVDDHPSAAVLDALYKSVGA